MDSESKNRNRHGSPHEEERCQTALPKIGKTSSQRKQTGMMFKMG
jgi:hypothetical protein